MPRIEEIMRMPLEERHKIYGVNRRNTSQGEIGNITAVKIDDVILTDYSVYSFFWEKTYVKTPERAMDGAISNLDSSATFITGHLKIDFSLMSIEDYRAFMKLVYKKNEFTVVCYDVIYDRQVRLKMYFATQELPKLWTIVNKIQKSATEWEDWIDLVGVEGCTVELIGTNTDNDVFEEYFN